MPGDVDQRLLLIERVVAERDGVGAGLDQLLDDGLGDAEAAGRVLAIDDDEIQLVTRAKLRQRVEHRLAARPADDIAKKKESHDLTVAVLRA